MTGNPLDRHERIALSFSGGKDSTACVYLLREALERITVYHVDGGELLPEMAENVARIEAFAPNFVRIETSVAAWIETHGLPTDLMPHSAHPLGQLMDEGAGTRLVSRYDCCWHNLMWPLLSRIKQDGCTLLIRGTKATDMRRLPAANGQVIDGIELYYPLQDWSHAQVLAFLAEQGVLVPRIYDFLEHGLDCATCPAWWSEHRGAYLKRFYPELYRVYDARLQLIINEVAPVLAELRHEAGVA